MTAGDQVLELKLKEIRADAELNVRAVDPRDEATRELAASIKAQGVLQPVTVTKDGKGYRLDFGFRRFHAAKLAGLATIPAIVREFTDSQIVEAQLVENVQRESLTPLEEARAIKRLLDAEPDRKQIDLAKQLGKSQPWISNRLRLLELPEPAVKAIESGQLSPTHGEILLQLPKEATLNEVANVLSRQKYSDMSAGTFKRLVQDRAATINRRTRAKQQRRGAISRAKFPECPVKGCGKRGSPEPTYEGFSKEFQCSNGHRWDSITGKLGKKESQRTIDTPRAPPKPTLPEVNPEVADHPGAPAVARRLLELIGEVQEVDIDSGGRGRVRLTLEAQVGELASAKFPPFRLGPRYGSKGSVAHIEGLYNQSTDKDRKAAAESKQALVDWFGTIRGVGRPKKDADPSPATEAAAATAPARAPGSKKSKKGSPPATRHADGPDPLTETARKCESPGCECTLPKGQRKYCGAPHPHAVGACEAAQVPPAPPASVEQPAAPAEAVAVTGAGTDGP